MRASADPEVDLTGKAAPFLYRRNDVKVVEFHDQHGRDRAQMSGTETFDLPYVGKARVSHRLTPRVACRLVCRVTLGAHEEDRCVVVRGRLKKSRRSFGEVKSSVAVVATCMTVGWMAEGVRRNCRVHVAGDILALLGSAVSSFASGLVRSHNSFQFFKKKVGGQATKPRLQPRLKTELFVVALRLTAPGVTGVFYALHSGTATPYVSRRQYSASTEMIPKNSLGAVVASKIYTDCRVNEQLTPAYEPSHLRLGGNTVATSSGSCDPTLPPTQSGLVTLSPCA